MLKGLLMRRLLPGMIVTLALAGCATSRSVQLVQQDVDELKSRLVIAEKSIATVKTEAKEISEKSAREAMKNMETLRKGTADMQANLDAMRIDVQVVAGRVEDLVLAAKKPFEDITLLKEDTAKAVIAMEERLKKLEAAAEENNARIAAIAKSLEPAATPENSYKLALDTLKNGDTVKARGMLSDFAERFPNHKLLPNVRYWIGESYYLEKNYEQAVLEFQRVIKEYPGKEKVSAAMLKQALSFKELGDIKSARFILKELIDKYPLAEEIAAAKEVLGKLK
jgi:tol-pal system protein YbgF